MYIHILIYVQYVSPELLLMALLPVDPRTHFHFYHQPKNLKCSYSSRSTVGFLFIINVLL